MKKSLWLISIMVFLSITLMGCATKGDLEKMQAQDQQMNMKVDEALKASQNANEAAVRAEERAKIAEEKAKIAEEKAKIAEEKAKIAEERAEKDAAFKRSMKK